MLMDPGPFVIAPAPYPAGLRRYPNTAAARQCRQGAARV